MRWHSVLLLLLAAAATGEIALATDDSGQTIEVQRGDSLYALVRTYFPDHSSAWTLIARDIVRLNPEAFRNGDPASLRVGAILRLPNVSAPEPSPSEAPAAAVAEPESEPEPSPAQSLAVIGEVVELRGGPIAIDINDRQRTLGLGSRIYRGDALLSDNGGALRVIMNDGAEMLLRPFSRLVIDEYTFIEAEPQASRSILRLLKGGLRAITGLIGRSNPAGFRVDTVVATIGVRGTDFGIRICATDDCVVDDSLALAPGTYSGVLDGEIALANDTGSVAVARGEFMRTVAVDIAPEPAPEAATAVFSASELAVLEPQAGKPMGFFQWLRYWLRGKE